MAENTWLTFAEEQTWQVRYGVSVESKERTVLVRLGKVKMASGAEGALVVVPAQFGTPRAFKTGIQDAQGNVRLAETFSRFELHNLQSRPSREPNSAYQYVTWAGRGEPGEVAFAFPLKADVR